MKSVLRVLGLILGWIALLILPVLIWYGLILLTNGWGFGIAASALTIAVTLLGWWALSRTLRLPGRIAMAAPALLIVVLMVALVVPLAPRTREIPRDSDLVATRYWELPTGSRLAYYHFPAQGGVAKKAEAILFVHGGPGGFASDENQRFFSRFANDGYDVYLYDQFGAGRSALLAENDYTEQRNYADLAAIIGTIPQPVILVGQSYGARLVAAALADDSVRGEIAKAAFTEPAPYATEMDFDVSKDPKLATTAAQQEGISLEWALLSKPRMAAAALVVPPGVGFAPQAEVQNAFDTNPMLTGEDRNYCAIDAGRVPRHPSVNNGYNMRVAMRINQTAFAGRDITPKLQHSRVPIMVALGECSIIQRRPATQIIRDYPAVDRVQYFVGVGHHIWNGLGDNDQIAYDSLLAFFEGRPATLPNHPTEAELDQFIAQGR